MPEHHDRRRLARAVRALAGAHPERRDPPRADLATRLDYLERDVAEVRTRVNALLFTVVAAAIGDLVARLFA